MREGWRERGEVGGRHLEGEQISETDGERGVQNETSGDSSEKSNIFDSSAPTRDMSDN